MKTEKISKRKVNKKGLVFLLLILYLLISFAYYIFTLPIKNIVVKNNKYLTENEIIRAAEINNYPNILKLSTLKIEKNIKRNKMINDVSVKKNIFGKVVITVTENKPLFINILTNKVVLSDGDAIEKLDNFIGLPTLINYVPNNIYNELISGLAKIDDSIIYKISEIEYSPDKSGEIVFDEARFLLRMNDSNLVYINTPNIKKLNNYDYIYAKVGSGGTLLLDSNSQNYIFEKK